MDAALARWSAQASRHSGARAIRRGGAENAAFRKARQDPDDWLTAPRRTRILEAILLDLRRRSHGAATRRDLTTLTQDDKIRGHLLDIRGIILGPHRGLRAIRRFLHEFGAILACFLSKVAALADCRVRTDCPRRLKWLIMRFRATNSIGRGPIRLSTLARKRPKSGWRPAHDRVENLAPGCRIRSQNHQWEGP